MASYYYKLPAGEGMSTLMGPVTQTALLDLRATLPPDTEVCEAETEEWTRLGDDKLTQPQDDGTIAIQPIPTGCYLGLFLLLGYVAFHAASIPNPILGLPYSVAEWIYGIASVILFRFRRGTLRQFWRFMLAFAIAGLAGLVIEDLS